jgi:hypothetical protein
MVGKQRHHVELVVTNCLHIGQPQLLLVDPQLHQGVVLGDAVVLAILLSPDELQRIGPIIIILCLDPRR